MKAAPTSVPSVRGARLFASSRPCSSVIIARTRYLRQREQRGNIARPAAPRLTPRQALLLVLLRPDDHSEEEPRTIDRLKRLDPTIGETVMLLDEFA